MYNSIKPGKIWLDTNGNPIQAHGLSVFYKDGIYYWYGENKEKTKGGSRSTIWHWGVHCYTSKDLYNWEDKGLIIPLEPDNLQSPLHPTYQMDRPHILFNEKTGKYVCWFKENGKHDAFQILTADRLLGPYQLVKAYYRPNGKASRELPILNTDKTLSSYKRNERLYS